MHQTPVAQVDSAKNLRLWGFSNCSLDYFNSFISELNKYVFVTTFLNCISRILSSWILELNALGSRSIILPDISE